MNPHVDRGTDLVAAAGVTSPFWLPPLATVSEVAALVLPIIGVVWLLIQMYSHIKKNWNSE